MIVLYQWFAIQQKQPGLELIIPNKDPNKTLLLPIGSVLINLIDDLQTELLCFLFLPFA